MIILSFREFINKDQEFAFSERTSIYWQANALNVKIQAMLDGSAALTSLILTY
jgi:hypothetical protein